MRTSRSTDESSRPRGGGRPRPIGRRRGRGAGRLRGGLLAAALALGLTALLPAAGQAAAPANQTGFDAERHGFLFTNNWTGNLSISLPVVGGVNFGSVTYGLCGGMTYAALDSHLTRARTPRNTTEPPAGSLRSYIWKRQIDSLTASHAHALRTFLSWQARPLNDKHVLGVRVVTGVKTLTRRQLEQKIRPRLRAGVPVPLGLVKVSGLSAPWKNHQVLAVGYRTLDRDDAIVAVYDPNHPVSSVNPDGITYLNMRTRRQSYDLAGTSPTGDTFRGFFRTSYSRKTPPWARADVRDHRTDRVRDHRTKRTRDHRTKRTRDHRTKRTRDHRTKRTRDHRRGA